MADETSRTAKLQFHYLKSPEYRELTCHGVIGGVAPHERIWMAVFTERPPIPRMVEFEFPKPDGNMLVFDEGASEPSHVETRTGIIRHIETLLYFDLATAKRLHAWLNQHIAALETTDGA